MVMLVAKGCKYVGAEWHFDVSAGYMVALVLRRSGSVCIVY